MAIIGSHNPWATTFGIFGNIISLMVYLAPLSTFYRIYKKKSTEGFQSVPYLVALFSSSLWLYYALLKIHDSIPLITINSFGCVIETMYIVMYITYAHKDAKTLTIKLLVMMNMGFFALILLVTYFTLHGSERVKVLGWICDIVSLCVFAAPLTIVAQVIKTKSVQFMPFSLSFFLTLNAIMWLAYGIFSKDKCIAYPNVGGLGLGILQMVLYLIYRNDDGEKEKEKEAALEGMINIVVVNPAEVFPIEVDDDINKQQNGGDQHKNKMVDCPM